MRQRLHNKNENIVIPKLVLLSVLFSQKVFSMDDDLFNLSLEELLEVKIEAASGTEYRQKFQPVSTFIIHRNDIATSGARTLNDLLNLYVPGYFKAEDKDDTIASFRGIAPDYNGKVLMLLNGVRVNADWFWGPADSLLNGIGLEFIERVEVVRGPGSVTEGQGAQLGVINIITRSTQDNDQFVISAGQGNWRQAAIMGHEELEILDVSWFVSKQQLDGFAMPEKGWGIEIQEGDSTHPNPPSLRGNRLNRNDAMRLMTKLASANWHIQMQHHQQKRDLYNWTKDRDQVEQRLTVLSGEYHVPYSDDFGFTLNANWQQDDYALYDHTTGLITGGARESRQYAKLEASNLKAKNKDSVHYTWLLAAEIERIQAGDKNWLGDNFIVNQVGQLDQNNSQLNTWLYKETYNNTAIMGELNYQISDEWRFISGIRLDDHAHWGQRTTPRLSVTYNPNQLDQVFRVSYQEGFKGAPGVHYVGGFLRDGLLSQDNLDELAGSGMTDSSTGEPVQNAASPMPEELTSVELALYGNLDLNWTYEINLYQNTLTDFIFTRSTRNGVPESAIGSDLVGTWGGVFYYANQPGEIKIRGIEVASTYRFSNVQHRLSYSTHDVVKADGYTFGLKSPVAGDADNIEANGVPEGIFRYQSNWQVTPETSVNYQHVLLQSWWAPWTNSRESGVNWANVSVIWQSSNQLRFKAFLNNIWDERGLYPVRARGKGNVNPGTPALEPRNLSLSLEYKF